MTIRCSKISKKALCGINRIWVHKNERRKGIATKMMDTLRYIKKYYFILKKKKKEIILFMDLQFQNFNVLLLNPH